MRCIPQHLLVSRACKSTSLQENCLCIMLTCLQSDAVWLLNCNSFIAIAAPALLCVTAGAGCSVCSYPVEDDGPTESDLFGEHHMIVCDSRP